MIVGQDVADGAIAFSLDVERPRALELERFYALVERHGTYCKCLALPRMYWSVQCAAILEHAAAVEARSKQRAWNCASTYVVLGRLSERVQFWTGARVVGLERWSSVEDVVEVQFQVDKTERLLMRN
ncbi:hypothetical protein Dimus_019732 [Dionaea muscipula]